MDLLVIPIILGLVAVVYGFVTSRQVLGSPAGSEKMQQIAGAIMKLGSAEPGCSSSRALSDLAACCVGRTAREGSGGRLEAGDSATGLPRSAHRSPASERERAGSVARPRP